ncbi:UvrD-helicase domain-containing protein [Candidatus Peregrinibacteria bacterium]|nr:MAG: UvrD-helicase domain-containing protein [Candidatus Peregrinibacteria bacterium]
MSLLDGLNEKQQEAVQATEGPVLIIAGAGSGKTRALTARVAYLIEEKNVRPWNILAVTFTNKAAGEMKERITKLLARPDFETEMPTVGTFHSICAQLLRRHIHLLGYENQFVIYDANDQVVLMKEIMKERHIDEKQLNPKAVLGHISQAKNQLMGPEDYAQHAHNMFTEKVGELYKPYQRRLAQNQALDFDDLILKTVELFEKFPELLDQYQERYLYISVDEYQDTNHAQYTLVKMLAAKYRNLCVIGDPDQSIYSWRGANMQNILDFEKDYPEALVIKLEQNYRSTALILDAAHAVIQRNQKRKEKKLWTHREGGEKLKVWHSRDERDEAYKVAEAILKHVRLAQATGEKLTPDYREFAVLYRTNAQSRVLEEAFMRFGIPYKIVGGVKFYLRKEIKDLIAYLRVIQNPNDSVSLLRIINTPARKIGPKAIEQIQNEATLADVSFFTALEKQTDSKAMTAFSTLIHHFRNLSEEFAVAGLIKHVIAESGYRDMLLADQSPEGEARLQNIQELISVADKYEALEPRISLATFLEEISLVSDLDDLDDVPNSVTLMTLHSAKGLEYPVVFITGLEEGIFPHSRALFEPHELEEERRLMYVGITRAMDHLYLLYAKQRMLFGEFKQNAPSQFLLDLPEDSVEGNTPTPAVPGFGGKIFGDPDSNFVPEVSFTPDDPENRPIPMEDDAGFDIPQLQDGDRVFHKTFGEGVVIQVAGSMVTVAFKMAGLRKLSLSIAPLRKI